MKAGAQGVGRGVNGPMAAITPEQEKRMDKVRDRMLEINQAARSKYHREIKPGVWVDVYDVLNAWGVSNPALSHLVKKALQPGQRGHKDRATDLDDIDEVSNQTEDWDDRKPSWRRAGAGSGESRLAVDLSGGKRQAGLQAP